ncbi:MAG: hypothetical protein KY467_01185 [Gemmatimonadetes bacterium]|nr:hypothetical protein [Gemmatimonadota bacterium]
MQQFYELRFVALRLSPFHLRGAREVHEAFALLALFPRAELARRGRHAVGAQKRLLVRSLGLTWGTDELPALGAVARAAGRRLAAQAASESLSPLECYKEGVRCRRAGEYESALRWFARAGERGAAIGAWDVAAKAKLGCGRVFWQRGDILTATLAYRAAAGLARDRAVPEAEASACHTLMVLSALNCDVAGVSHFAKQALDAYGPTHPNLLSLASDLATFWMDTAQSHRALPVLKALVARGLPTPRAQMIAASNLALCAARAGEGGVSKEAFCRAYELATRATVLDSVASALLSLAETASVWGDAARACEMLALAETVARSRDERAELARASQLREPIQRGSLPTSPDHGDVEPWGADADLCDRLVAALR